MQENPIREAYSEKPGANCEGCSRISDKLSAHGFCERYQRDSHAREVKHKKQEAIRSMREAGVL